MDITDIKGYASLSNGVKMPYLGLGVYKANDGDEVKHAVREALAAGYRHIDTAMFYNNEEGVGQAIKDSGIPREEIFITTKVWIDDQGYESTFKAFEKSLKNLDCEYIDLYLVHWPVPDKYVETYKAMEELYQQGKIKAIGVCNCMPHHLETLKRECSITPMVLQNEFHPRLVQQDIIDYCKERNIQYEGWSPLMRGEILENEELKQIAERHGKTVAQVVLRWDLQKGVVTIPKSVHAERIKENASLFDFELSKEEMQVIDNLDRDERTGAHPDNFMDHF